MVPIDQIQINFNPQALSVVNYIIGLIIFGVALDIKIDDFKRILRGPKAPLVGLIGQFFILPGVAFCFISLFPLDPSISLGIILISSCPGGNLSNFLTSLAGGNTALSVTMSSISTLACVFMLPLNLNFWGSLNSETSSILQTIDLSFISLFITIMKILIIPTLCGIFFSLKFPNITKKIRKLFSLGSIIAFGGFVVGAIILNIDYFLDYMGMFFFIVVLTNFSALGIGYGIGVIAKLGKRDTRTITFEVGIQNAAFGLVIVFNFFNGLGGMAIVCAFWGVWHIISGLSLAIFWMKNEGKEI